MRVFLAFLSLCLVLVTCAAVAVVFIFKYYSENLPDYSYLKDYQPALLSRVYADDGRMMATFASEQRVFVPITAIPPRVIDAFLSAEDEDFYHHSGVDFMGVLRAVLVNIQNIGRDKHPMGASTITQQVAKNMLLTNEVSYQRKIKEAILAMRIEKVLSKDRILEIYLNEIFLGSHSYGVAAAALNYFNKSLDELTIDEAAYLAALPKAPNNYNPTREHDAAVGRRNWVISRMLDNGYINKSQADQAMNAPLEMRRRDETETVSADYFSEEVRRELVEKYGEDKLLEGGLAVKTSLDPRLQAIATNALRQGLITYDRRDRGWRGPVKHILDLNNWRLQLSKTPPPPGGEEWQLALVTGLTKSEAQIAFVDNKRGHIPWEEMSWARSEKANDTFGPPVHQPADVLSEGDVVLVEPIHTEDNEKTIPSDTYTLRQVPVVEGAIVVLDPHTGRVYAMTGGFSDKISQFDRATQALRQPGSAFKPFVYMAALDKGFTPSSLILDAPFDYFQGPGLPLWHPENYSKEFYGPSPLRVGIEKSRNVMTVRLANAIGMSTVAAYAKKFGIVDEMPELLAFALGAKETTPLKLTTAYGMIDNGGKRITPSFVDRIMDRDGKTMWRADQRDCTLCQNTGWTPNMLPPDIPDNREQVEDPRTTAQMVSILEGVVQRGTAISLHNLGIPLAGKTGTTNEDKDAWFIGFTPDLVCGVYVGFDDPKPLGSHETGASVAVPIFREFISQAMKGKPAVPFRMPPGLRMVRVNPGTGALASANDHEAIWESFIPGTEPQENQPRQVLDGSVTGSASQGAASALMTPVVIEGAPSATEHPLPPGATPETVTIQNPGTSVVPAPILGAPAGAPTLNGTPLVIPPSPQPSQSQVPSTTVGTGGLY